jgi:pentatricopeptide repeat protein
MAACVKGNRPEEALQIFSLMIEKVNTASSKMPKHLKGNKTDKLNTDTDKTNKMVNILLPQNSSHPLIRDAYSYGTALNALGRMRRSGNIPK